MIATLGYSFGELCGLHKLSSNHRMGIDLLFIVIVFVVSILLLPSGPTCAGAEHLCSAIGTLREPLLCVSVARINKGTDLSLHISPSKIAYKLPM